MSNTVFVNGRGFLHAKSSCKNINFPCVGKTPGPPPPFIPIPYPNISAATDTSKGSKKVKFQGKEVMLKNTSKFKKSQGNEAATSGGGIITAKKGGKGNCAMYSGDVLIENKEVARAMDLMMGND